MKDKKENDPVSKRLTSLVLIIILLLSLIVLWISCGGGNPVNSGDTTNNTAMENDYNTKNREEGESNDVYSPEEPEGEDETAGETYKDYGINPEISTEEENTSTFAIDVDTGSYSISRRFIMENDQLPKPESVRAEEFINYFDYNYVIPTDTVFAVQTDIARNVFRPDKHTLRIGIQGKDISPEERKRANLVFLIDVSGSMRTSKKITLVKESLKILLNNLNPDDYVGIAVYAGMAAPYLPSTPVSEKDKIIKAIDGLNAGGSTNAEGGIKIAYEMVSENYIEDGINRVILCSDGDANVGNVDPNTLSKLVEDYRKDLGITLSTFGYGMGNYNDYFMEQLANTGDGNYGYIDSIEEAQRVFGKKLISILQEIARDVKVQIEFNKDTVNTFRLIGYENRKLDEEDFRDDTVDAGEVGALHSVTAIYELTLSEDFINKGEFLYELRLRWKDDKGEEVFEANTKLPTKNVKENIMQTTPYYRLAISVAEFAEILRESPYATGSSHEELMKIIVDALNEIESPDEKFNELLEIINKAQLLKKGGEA
jgi:Ca-activated chloride channel homolog